MIETVYINLGILAINLVVFALSLKLYTEMLKDKSQDRRVKKPKLIEPATTPEQEKEIRDHVARILDEGARHG